MLRTAEERLDADDPSLTAKLTHESVESGGVCQRRLFFEMSTIEQTPCEINVSLSAVRGSLMAYLNCERCLKLWTEYSGAAKTDRDSVSPDAQKQYWNRFSKR
jgi:hypothetical protein